MNHEPDPLADALRASLARHAAEAPAGDRLAEQIISAADRAPVRVPAPSRRRGGWRTWTLPLVAAGAVGAVVLAVVGIENYHPSADKAPLAGSSSLVRSSPATRPATAAPTTDSAPAASLSPAYGTDLHHVRIVDLTFARTDLGWALASADCVRGSGRCTALLRTSDGTSWHSMPGAAFNVDGVKGCADPCVTNLRFATDQIGYAYGPSALFMTTDGGASWTQQLGFGADALESLNGNVIMAGSGPRGPVFQRAAIGSTKWTPIDLPGGPVMLTQGNVFLARVKRTVVLLASAYNPAKGYQNPAVFYRSGDDGITWHKSSEPYGEPCPAIGAGYSDTAVGLTVGGDGSVVIACVGRDKQQTFFGGSTITSTDGGRTFTGGGGKLGPAWLVGAADASHQFVYAPVSSQAGETRGGFYASAGPLPWNLVPDISGQVTFIGFESTSVGRVVADGGRTIWTTRDAGVTWRPVTMP
jgi:photosystem II stability/assembly factor-like uncharacterized protein